MNSKITINGREYESVDQMPPEARRAYEQAMSALADRDGNGVPDILEGGKTSINATPGGPVVTKVVTHSRFVVNGQEYERWEDIPPDMQAKLNAAGVQQGKRAIPGPVTTSPGGITIRVTLSTVLGLLAAIAVLMWMVWILARTRR